MIYMTRNNFYVITGGPGAGKTSLLDDLASKGYSYVPETARRIIQERISRGLTPRPDPANFAQQIFDQDWENFISNSNSSSILFFDRSFIDSAWMLFDANVDNYNQIKNTYLANRYNNTVFITPPWKEIFRNDEERDQSFEESVQVYERLDKWYREHGYDIIVLPKESIENRARFVLNVVDR